MIRINEGIDINSDPAVLAEHIYKALPQRLFELRKPKPNHPNDTYFQIRTRNKEGVQVSKMYTITLHFWINKNPEKLVPAPHVKLDFAVSIEKFMRGEGSKDQRAFNTHIEEFAKTKENIKKIVSKHLLMGLDQGELLIGRWNSDAKLYKNRDIIAAVRMINEIYKYLQAISKGGRRI